MKQRVAAVGVQILVLVGALAAGLLVGAILLGLTGVNPAKAYLAMFTGPVSGRYGLTETLVRATPMLLVGTGIVASFRTGILNIGGEGQMLAGTVAGAAVALATGSFGDLVQAGEVAKVHMDAGADILTGSAQQSVGAVRAVAARPGAMWVSTDMDQAGLAPDTVLAAQVYNWQKVVQKMIDLRAQGKLGGEHLTLSFADGTLELKVNPKLESRLTAEAKQALEKARQDITSGKLKVELPKN